MPQDDLQSDEAAKWSSQGIGQGSTVRSERGPLVSPNAETDEAILGKDGPLLDASSGICLIIVVYATADRIGAIIHLAREESLSDLAHELIRRPFAEWPGLQRSPYVGLISSRAVAAAFPRQIQEAKSLIAAVAQTADINDVWVGGSGPDADGEFDMGVDVTLNTRLAILEIEDDFGMSRTISVGSGI